MHPLRKACADAIRLCDVAEQQAKQIQEAAARERLTALSDARQKHAQVRRELEAAVKEVRDLAQQADRILAYLGLIAVAPTPFVPPRGAGRDELIRLLHNHRSQARDILNRLSADAEALEEERRKWWKFW